MSKPNDETIKAMRELRAGGGQVFWQFYLKPDEAARLEAIKAERLALSREARRIFDRARKRARRN